MTRPIKAILFFSSCTITTIVAVSLLFIILSAILTRAMPAISLEFLVAESKDFGQDGGIFYQIIGTIMLIVGAGILSLPVALGTAIYQTEYINSSFQRTASVLIYALNGVPTILFGLFGYKFFGILLKMGVSWLTGSFILAIMILPTLVVSIKEAIESIPVKYREAGLALGFTTWRLIKTVLIPQSFFGIVTGLLLGLARATGETAAIMFTATAFSGITMPNSFLEPVTTLQTHIFVLAQEAVNPQARTNAWGAALVLVVLVFLMSLGSMLVRRRLTLEAER
ncbi:phosphate ABC transporter permease PstA [candidate division KSB1 bacterium]|nr:phosphate ABC transporter permease PstA [candidate division KSB1 bacterium]NIR69355.1 phosphate ABC transporter permease PstA [candidate division KSB1 bacterium]NIS24173.1 phosphate ABC transporter permease PstA [candidate division KSB1 bacterium]NIT71088.1 phosphate ABC transporter permease PstA [candidate division KSB1 bacterium]NIU24792.1 phosphate ABC transporter permease PstA [candidate division KSB1 bacterium]